jgi:preprotein translocase subunit SecE
MAAFICVVLTTGKSRKEECPLSEENVENPCPIPAKKELGIIQSFKQAPEFVASVRQEIRLLQRPTWYEVRSTTVMVVIFFCLFLLYFYLLGRVLALLGRWLPLG